MTVRKDRPVRYDRSVTGKVVSTRHAGTSVNGNPSYWVTMDDGETYGMQADTGLAYGITNPEYRESAYQYDLTRPTRNASAGRMTGYCRKVAE